MPKQKPPMRTPKKRIPAKVRKFVQKLKTAKSIEDMALIQQGIDRPDTDDPRDMMPGPAEAACEVEAGPLLPPKYPDEDWDETKEDDEEAADNNGETP